MKRYKLFVNPVDRVRIKYITCFLAEPQYSAKDIDGSEKRTVGFFWMGITADIEMKLITQKNVTNVINFEIEKFRIYSLPIYIELRKVATPRMITAMAAEVENFIKKCVRDICTIKMQ